MKINSFFKNFEICDYPGLVKSKCLYLDLRECFEDILDVSKCNSNCIKRRTRGKSCGWTT